MTGLAQLAPAPGADGRYGSAFAGLAGHPGPVRTLTAALDAGRMAHALLFHGPAGVGKGTAAGMLAAALLCRGAGARPCGTCAPCGRLAHGNAFDLVRVEPDGAQIKIEQVRALKDRLPAGTGGVALIEPADAMNAAAANALLKTLEEPPPGWTLVLVTARPESLAATIRSRCQAVRFGRLGPDATATVLAARGVPPEHRELLATLAEGAPGAVLEAGMEPAELAGECAEAFAVLAPEALHSPARIFAAAEAWGRDADRTRRFLRRVQLWVSEALRGAPAAPVGAGSPAAWGRRFPPGFLASFTLAVQEVEERLERNVNRPTAIEALLVTLRGGLASGEARP